MLLIPLFSEASVYLTQEKRNGYNFQAIFFGVAALCKLIFASQKLSTLPRENFFPYYIFFSSRRGLLSSRRGLSSSRRGLLSSRRELKNYI